MVTIRQKILNKLHERLEARNWQLFQPSVHIGRVMFDPDSDNLPIVTIVAQQDTAEPTRYGLDLRHMPVTVSALVAIADAKEAHAECEPIYGELHAAIFDGGELELVRGPNMEGNYYFPIRLDGGGLLEYPDTSEGQFFATVGVNITITYETAIGDPYN